MTMDVMMRRGTFSKFPLVRFLLYILDFVRTESCSMPRLEMDDP